jgi:ADP-heptose:LPS heptosyltransferase
MRRNKSKILAHRSVIAKKTKIGFKKKDNFKFVDSKKICIYAENGGVGDILMLTPAVKKLREKYPDSYIELAIHSNGANDNIYNFLMPSKYINKVSNFRNVRKERFGTFIDVSEVAEPSWEIQGINLKSRINYYAELLKVELDNRLPIVEIDFEKDQFIKRKLANYKKVFFIDTSSVDPRRCIHPNVIKNLINIINENNSNHCILVSDWKNIGSWKTFANVIDVTKKSLREICSYIKYSDIFFGPDSALMHISAAVKTKSIIAFGMIPPEYRIATYPTHQAIRVESLSCLGCWYKPCYNNLRCMKMLDCKEIYKKMERM